MKKSTLKLIGAGILVIILYYGEDIASSGSLTSREIEQQLDITMTPTSCKQAINSVSILKNAFRNNVLRTFYFPGEYTAYEIVSMRKKITTMLPECFTNQKETSWTIQSPVYFTRYTTTIGPNDKDSNRIDPAPFSHKLHLPLNLEFWKLAVKYWQNDDSL